MSLCWLAPGMDGHMNTAVSILETFNLNFTLFLMPEILGVTKPGNTRL